MAQGNIGPRMGAKVAAGAALLAVWLASGGTTQAEPTAYPVAAQISDYRMGPADEIAMARSAAPPSISNDAQIMILGAAGYETAANGANGFVCMVQRGWGAEPDDPVFWNPKIRGPICFNPASARSVLPTYLERTRWVLAGATREQVAARTKAEVADGKIGPPETGSMAFMMSRIQNLGENGGHWRPHLMIYLPRGAGGPPDWGADLAGSPVLSGGPGIDPAAVYFVPVTKWSDGTAAVTGG